MARSILKADDARVRPLPLRDLLAPQADASAPAPKAVCETRVETLRQDGAVIGLEVHCSCGEVTRVSLDYGPESGSQPQEGPAAKPPGAQS